MRARFVVTCCAGLLIAGIVALPALCSSPRHEGADVYWCQALHKVRETPAGADLAGYHCFEFSMDEASGSSTCWSLHSPGSVVDRIRGIVRFGIASELRYVKHEDIEPTGTVVEMDGRRWERFAVRQR